MYRIYIESITIYIESIYIVKSFSGKLSNINW